MAKPKNYADALEGDDRNVATAIIALFESYGLGSLAKKIVEFVRQGYSADTISIMLQETAEYKQRFAANEVRKKKGIAVLSPAEYISTESAFRQLMHASGLPVGFYDSNTDFENWIANDVSPTEVKERVDAVSEALNRAPSSTVDYFKQYYETGDMIAYALDPTKAKPLIEQRLRAATAGAVAELQGFSLERRQAELIGRQGTSLEDMQAGLGFIAQELPTVSKLGDIYGDQLGTEDLVEEVFTGSAQATQRRKKLASQERAAFSGGSGQGQGSLSKGGAGSV